MYTIIIVTLVAVIAVIILSIVLEEGLFLELAVPIVVAGMTCVLITNDMSEASKGVEVATPAKYINQTYYIEHKQLYVQYNDTIKKFGGDISSKIEYSTSKEPAIKFKTVKIKGDPDDWIPFKYKEASKTYISKVILPKEALTEELTKLTVLK